MTLRVTILWGVLSCAMVGAASAQRLDTKNPHGRLEQLCATCHSAAGWVPAKISASFDHGKSGFPLEGAHATVTCKSCHTTLTFKGASRDCASCHKDPHQGELGSSCARCHTMRSFVDRTGMTRAHQLSRFPLTGAHVTADCESCHARSTQGHLTFTSRSTACNDCHLKDYQTAKSPDHAGGGFSQTCEQCHATLAWQSARFDHSRSNFPLTGAHLAVSCAQCHGTGRYGALPTACVSCHQTDYNNAANPNHPQAQFPTDCTACHTTATWTGATFNHNATAFPLTGAHVQLTCDRCHGDGVYKGKPTTCVSCHQTDYNNATNPNHPQAQFPTDCTACHTTTTWTGATFNHSATAFPLTGAHLQATCDQCHGDGVYKGKSTACVSCHQTDFNNATNPNHVQSQFPTDCTACHTTRTWTGATFDHNATAFPLTGAHLQATCAQCHGDGVYKGKSTACVSCHLTDYNSTTDPNHAQAQFSTDCVACHATTVWTTATYTSHDAQYFPIYSGAHANRWQSCSTCHINPSDYRQFDCLSCHGKTVTDSHHTSVSGYSYDSQSCYRCHPRGTH
ncbi:MAG TPA: hypothetical protein VLB49_04415 [Gemmatimonadales bacterium]|nr:hypothetical protein [Gemmatimonadales bacterium]